MISNETITLTTDAPRPDCGANVDCGLDGAP